MAQLIEGEILRIDGRSSTVTEVARLEHGVTACLVDAPGQWGTLLLCDPAGTAEVYELRDPAGLVESEHAAAVKRVVEEDTFWAAQGDTDAVIGELTPATAPPSSLLTLAHDDFLACESVIAGVLYDHVELVYWVVRAVEDVTYEQLGLEPPATERRAGRFRRWLGLDQ